jgi:glyoxylase-like metal-dependent hydrolase (beta-lactamase superfamily II)
MSTPRYHPLDHDITCIDALYIAPELACCYLIGDSGEYALIETGTSRSNANIHATLDALGVEATQLRYVIPTHVHLDHAGGAGLLMQQFPGATLLIHPRGARHMIDPTRLVESSVGVYGRETFEGLYGSIPPVEQSRVRTLEDGATVSLGRRTLRVMHTRGHAEHHFCLYDELSEGWFSGDMFGVSYPGLRFAHGAFVMPATTPTQFDPEEYKRSVRRLAAARPRSFYLTHYSALPFRDEQVDLLCSQLDAYAGLCNSPEVSDKALEDTIHALTLARLRDYIGGEVAPETAAALRADAALNAQGIAWRRRGIRGA